MRTTASITKVLLVLVAFSGPGSHGAAAAQALRAGDAGLEAFLAQVEAAQVELVRGHPDAFKALWSRTDDVTLVGGLGGAIERGWAQVSQRLDWVASQYGEGTRRHKEVSRLVSGELAYVVQRESISFRQPGDTGATMQELRATMVFRLEPAGWRIVHRHADSQLARRPNR